MNHWIAVGWRLIALVGLSLLAYGVSAMQQSETAVVRVETLAELPAATGGVAVDQDGNIFVADINRAPVNDIGTIYKVTPEGDVSVFVESPALITASGNAFDSKGNLFQSSLREATVSKITPDGDVSVFASEGIVLPVGIAIDADDTLFVANCGNNTIQKVTAEGVSTRFASSQSLFNCPNGIAFDNDGNLYVANFSDGRVLKVLPDGSVSQFAVFPGRNNGHITYADGKFYLVARGDHRVYSLDLEGNFSVIAGSGARGHSDGPAADATFSLPNDLGISPDGTRLYVNEVEPVVGIVNQPSRLRVIVLESQSEQSP